MSSPLVFILNTHGVIIFVIVVVLYEIFVIKNIEVAMHVTFAAFGAFVIALILKELYVVPRPFIFSATEAKAGLALLSSFPSAHTAISFAVATTITLHQKRFGVLAFMVASLIGVGRVLANVHYPIDIIFGILIGVTSGMFFDSVHFAKKRK